MKKSLKIIFAILASLMILILGFIVYVVCITATVKLDDNKLIDFESKITFYSSNNEILSEESNNIAITNIEELPEHLINAFISIEDKRFYSHHGVDYRGFLRATLSNIKSFSFKEGASTISQQLIKNTHLSNEKTFSRKLVEIKLAKELEKKYTKSQIMEKYLNTIYFGGNCYGITSASKYYFGKLPEFLDVNESATLAGIIKAPSNYSPFVDMEKCVKRKNVVLKEMFNQGYIDQKEYEQNSKLGIKTINNDEKPSFNYVYLAKKDLDKIIDLKKINGDQINVYTYCDMDLQKIIEKNISDNSEYDFDKSLVITDKNNHFLAYKSTCGDIKRSPGSTIKPLAVYAPSIEDDLVYSCSPILDEKTDFNGYSPSNYKGNYHGYVTVKQALAKSLNVPAVKILSNLGVENSIKYLNKLNIETTNNDHNLSIALGGLENGVKLTTLTSAYNVFNNQGNYITPTTIEKITDKNGNILYESKVISEKVFGADTTYIMNDMMRETVIDGTAKKLNFNNYFICAKTGTVGNDHGNTDAYTISYTNDYILGCWCGKVDGQYIDNNITGGSFPASLSLEVWGDLYKKKEYSDFPCCQDVVIKNIDKTSFEKDRIIEIVDADIPEKYVLKGLFKKYQNKLPSSNRYSNPKIENAKISVNNNEILISLCVAEYCDFRIFKQYDRKKETIYDTNINQKNYQIKDKNLIEDKTYVYSIVPYLKINGKEILGDEYYLPKIKSPTNKIGDWWIDNFKL